MQEKWVQWKPLENLANKYSVKLMTMSMRDFKILLIDTDADTPDVSIVFSYPINTFRNSEEAFRLQTIGYLNENYGGDFYSTWSLFKVENSEYLKWLSEQSGGLSDFYKMIHFCIITDDEIFDFVASDEPKVEFVS